ncbi:DUF4041 domain-containing protein [Clostridium botulinum]|uniref:DUF4041 domain-containing protein n=1 Tax=Clostridium botulinum TaxID=1491 RepID=UPI0004D62B89|nr:DUF4041 domain-containing protein [Clostridium botulinum]KEH90579.1 hypothetical protein Z963_11695 [Clostridium botulinum C/D str. It1]
MSFFDIFKIKKFKEEISTLKNNIKSLTDTIEDLSKENANLNNIKYDLDKLKYKDLKLEISKLLDEHTTILNSFNLEKSKQENEIYNKKSYIDQLDKHIDELNNTIINLEEENLMQSFGFYNPKYNLENSELYKESLNEIRKQQKQMVKDKTAINYTEWTVNGSKSEGKKMTNDMIKLTLRAFNLECDNSILKVKFNNIDTCKKRLTSAFDTMNKLGRVTNVTISNEYLNLKFQELYLAYEYELKKQEEKEEQKAIKERMREEAKVLKELEATKKKIEKEEIHFNKAITEIKLKLENANDSEKSILLNQLSKLENQLKKIENDKEDLINREQNTRAGYVYIISNIGSFGQDIYKIGMTRRLEPMDRVSELSNASVPFSFDVHAMIFSDDAPSLENKLHKEFEKYRLNKVNFRKEFFKVSLLKIEEVVKKNHNKVVEFTKLALAEDYRKSLKIDQESNPDNTTF